MNNIDQDQTAQNLHSDVDSRTVHIFKSRLADTN